MIDININAIISQALAAAVQQATAPLLERIAALENQALVVSDAVDKRLRVLENNPAQGVDTTLNAWEMAMQNRVDSADAVAKRLHERVAALETKLTEADLFTKTTEVHINKDELLEYLDNQEWFWDKLRNFTDTAVEQAVEQHCEEYAHDDYDNVVSALDGVDLNDYVQKDSFRDELKDVLNNATLRIRF